MCWQSIDLDGSLIYRGFLVEGDRPFASVPPNLLGVSPMSELCYSFCLTPDPIASDASRGNARAMRCDRSMTWCRQQQRHFHETVRLTCSILPLPPSLWSLSFSFPRINISHPRQHSLQTPTRPQRHTLTSSPSPVLKMEYVMQAAVARQMETWLT